MKQVGRVGLIGGVLRDLCFANARKFRSDLDFVLDIEHRDAFDSWLSQHDVKRNSFGGFKMNLGKVQIDFWEAQASWACVQGIRHVQSLEDVLETTFFNIDAMIYVVDDNTLLARDGTLEAIRARKLDINLERNPNPLGAVVRALRRMYALNLSASNALTHYIARGIDDFGWKAIVARDNEAYPHAPIVRGLYDESMPSGSVFLENMKSHRNRVVRHPQLELFHNE